LKPANILLDEGKAMIADLGKARLRPASEGSGATDTRLLGTAEYAPPENFDEKGGYAEKRHGRAFDMWAIGCIMIEVAILICYGWEGNLVKTFRTERESLALNLRPFQGHIRNSEQTSRKLESAFYNSIPVIYAWLAKLQSFRHENASEAWKLRKYLRIAVHMLRGNPDARMFSWEAVLDFFDLLHPNASDHERLLKAKEFIQGPNKPGLIDTPIHRAVKRGDLIRVVCLASAEWSADLKNGDEKTPIEIAQEQGHIEIESYLKYVLQRKRLRASDLLPFALIHEVETDCHGFRENTTTSLVPPPPEIWRTSGEEALPHEPLDIPLPAQEYLSRFLENTESTVLYFWNFSATDWADWLIGAIYNLAYGMKDKGHHVIFQEIIEGDDHTKLVVDFTKALLKCFPPLLMEDEDSFVAVDHLRQIVLEHSKLRKPTLPILLVITIATHEEFSGHISSEFLDLIIEHSAPDNGLFKTFFMSESWIDDIGNTLKKYGQDGQQYDVSDWSSIPLRFWCRWEH
jgi:serine/threonine protein kinase